MPRIVQTKTLALCLALIALGGCKYIFVPAYEVVDIPLTPQLANQDNVFRRHLGNEGTLFGLIDPENNVPGFWRNGESFPIPTIAGYPPVEGWETERGGFLLNYVVGEGPFAQRINRHLFKGVLLNVPELQTANGNPIAMFSDGLGTYAGFDGASREDVQPGDSIVIWNAAGLVRRLNIDLESENPVRLGGIVFSEGLDRIVAFLGSFREIDELEEFDGVDDSIREIFIWTPDSPDPMSLNPPEGANAFAVTDMNSDGTMCGVAWFPFDNGMNSVHRAFVYTDHFEFLPQLGEQFSRTAAFSMNTKGDIVGSQESVDQGFRSPVLWRRHPILKTYMPVNISELMDRQLNEGERALRMEINDSYQISFMNLAPDPGLPLGAELRLYLLRPTGIVKYDPSLPHDEAEIAPRPE